MQINTLYNSVLYRICVFTCFPYLQMIGSFSVHFCFLFVPQFGLFCVPLWQNNE